MFNYTLTHTLLGTLAMSLGGLCFGPQASMVIAAAYACFAMSSYEEAMENRL